MILRSTLPLDMFPTTEELAVFKQCHSGSLGVKDFCNDWNGGARFLFRGQPYLPQRLVAEWYIGHSNNDDPIYVACGNQRCVNPNHLSFTPTGRLVENSVPTPPDFLNWKRKITSLLETEMLPLLHGTLTERQMGVLGYLIDVLDPRTFTIMQEYGLTKDFPLLLSSLTELTTAADPFYVNWKKMQLHKSKPTAVKKQQLSTASLSSQQPQPSPRVSSTAILSSPPGSSTPTVTVSKPSPKRPFPLTMDSSPIVSSYSPGALAEAAGWNRQRRSKPKILSVQLIGASSLTPLPPSAPAPFPSSLPPSVRSSPSSNPFQSPSHSQPKSFKPRGRPRKDGLAPIQRATPSKPVPPPLTVDESGGVELFNDDEDDGLMMVEDSSPLSPNIVTTQSSTVGSSAFAVPSIMITSVTATPITAPSSAAAVVSSSLDTVPVMSEVEVISQVMDL